MKSTPNLSRRSFLEGIFGTAVVAAAGAIPVKLLALPEKEFHETVMEAANFLKPSSGGVEIWANRETGDYSFTPMPGFVPCREESNAIANRVLGELYAKFRKEA